MTTRYLSLFNKIPIHIKLSRTKRLWPFMCMGALLLAQQSAQAAKCEYIVSNEWNTGFVATIRITNDSATTINNWSVNWAYSDGSLKTSSWNATIAGNNPYSASGVGWNNTINPGQFIEFGVQGNKGIANASAPKPAVTGSVCGSVGHSSSVKTSEVQASSAKSVASSSQIGSSVISSVVNTSARSSLAPASSSIKSSTPVIPSSSSVRSSSSIAASSSTPVVVLPPPAPVGPFSPAKYTMKVDIATRYGALKKPGIGSLFGLHSAMKEISAEDFLWPVQINTSQWQGRIGENGGVPMNTEAVADVARAGKSKMLLRFNDLLYGWPYRWKNMSEWNAQIDQAMKNVATYKDVVYAIAPFNEPDNKFQGDFMTDPIIQGGTYDARVNWLWTYTVRLIRSYNTGIKIMGPNYEHYRPWDPARGDHTRMRNFLINAINTNTVPEIMGWHNLGPSPGDVPFALGSYYRQLEAELNVPGRPLPIAVEEYGPGSGDFEGVAGTIMKHFAELERARVDWAAQAVFTAGGALGNTLRNPWDYQGPNAGWWLMKWYRDMTGEYVYSDRWDKRLYQSFDGLASFDAQQKRIQVLVGGSDDDGDILISGLNGAGLGSEVRVLVEVAHWQKDPMEFDAAEIELAGDVNLGTEVVYEKEFTIGNANELRVPIRRMNKYDAYRISVTPRAKTEEKNLVARYKFEPGLTAVDSQGGAALRLTGADSIAKGKYLDGGAVHFNGSNGHAQLPNGLLDAVNDFTVSTWVKLDSKTPWARVFDFGKGTGSYMMLTVRDAQNNIRFDIANAGVTNSLVASGDLISTGIWHHLAIAQRGSNARLFIDGVEVANSSAFSLRANQLAPTTANYVGRSQFVADSYLDGAVDDLRIYNRALSRFEITNLIAHKYEAENAQVTGGALHLGADALFMSSNDGYVGGLDFNNSKLQFALNVPKTGIYTLAVRYANGTADDAVNYVQANGVAQRVIDLPPTGGWLNQQAQIARGRVLLQAGDNVLVIGRQSGFAEIDYIEVREDTHQYQAEMAKINNASYAAQFFAVDNVKSVVGRMDYSDSTIEFMVDAPQAGSYTLKIAYANGTTANAVHTVLVNGASATSASYAPSGGWFSARNPTAIRGITDVTVQLNAGYNRVVLQRASGYAEIDYVQLLAIDE